MQRSWSKEVWILLLVAAVAVTVRCGGRAGRLARLEVPGIGFSMEAPSGWKVSRKIQDFCFKGNQTGMVLVEQYHAGFEAYVDRVSHGFGAHVLSRSSTRTGGHRAVEVVSVQEQQGVKILHLFIDLGGRVVEVSFVVLKGNFVTEEPKIREALGTIILD